MPQKAEAKHQAEKSRACPICGKPASQAEQPFCSRRCADVDLHRWLSGAYAVPARPDDATDEFALDEAGPGQDEPPL